MKNATWHQPIPDITPIFGVELEGRDILQEGDLFWSSKLNAWAVTSLVGVGLFWVRGAGDTPKYIRPLLPEEITAPMERVQL